MVGTVLGIGGFVAIVGLSQTAAGQIGKDFNVQDATQVTVGDSGAAKARCPRWTSPPGADAWPDRIHGVIAAGVWWSVSFKQVGGESRLRRHGPSWACRSRRPARGR